MKDTDKITLTVAQLKQLVKESKLNESIYDERKLLSKIADKVDTAKYWFEKIYEYEKYTNPDDPRKYSKSASEIDTMHDEYQKAIRELNQLVSKLIEDYNY